MALVLNTGVDPVLMATRKMILERAGHKVVMALTSDEARRACEQNAFDVVIIGQMVSRKEKELMLTAVRQSRSSAKVLELYTVETGRMMPDADDWLEVPTDVPPELAARVTELAKRRN